MKKSLTLIALVLTTLCASAQKPISLFNGKTLEGWSTFTKEISDSAADTYSVESKCINISGAYGYIYTDAKYKSYTLTLEWRWVGVGSNSGVFLNMAGENKCWPNCYEVQLANGMAGDIIHSGDVTSDEFYSVGKKVTRNKKDKEKAIGKWNTMEVTCKDNTLTVYINGTKQSELHNISQKSGHIGLQSEGKGIQFRNIELTQL
ncbi:MAG: DUF1080 domain-containing protein [Rikenellaceae bacterium]